MTDRQVRQVVPPLSDDESPERIWTFSEFSDHPNIVLLGDPGAGKTHLFRSFSTATGGRFLSVRAFLNIPAVPASATLFIDALDEKRTGRGDDDAIDQVVRKLFAARPEKIRISCRDRDWLGQSDLAAFQPYFDQTGGAVVLSLQALSGEEQCTLLRTQDVADPDRFISEATERGLDDFLTNPQNLIMLAQAVRGGDWPMTRSNLFEISTRFLLSEHNPEHARAGDGVYGAEELRSPAGALFAARLISDVEGISLSDQDGSPNYPNYRAISVVGAAEARAALGRRIFTAAGEADAVDYTHRTTAEYLAAAWIAQAVRNGLPVGRVRALLGIDGHPAAELRGLHAWLAVFLPEHADLFIDTDPYGVLTYGDAASLTPSSRRRLVDALSCLSQTDPWFRSGNWSSAQLGSLSGPDMVDAFLAVLRSPDSNFALRSVVVDALALGPPLPALLDELLAILLRPGAPYAERRGALLALLRIGQQGKDAVRRDCREQLGADVSALRLRAEIISTLYGDGFGPADVAVLFAAALGCDEDLPVGSLWSLSRQIPLSDIPEILDSFEELKGRPQSAEHPNIHDLVYVIDQLLLRLLQGMERPSANQLWNWLRTRRTLRDAYYRGESEEIREALKARPELLHTIVDDAINGLAVDEHRWGFIYNLRETSLYAIDNDDLLEHVAAHLPKAEAGGDKEAFLYQQALMLSQSGSSRAISIFEQLYALGDHRPELAAIRDELLTATMPDWQAERNQTIAQARIKEQEDFENLRRDFERDEAAIRGGVHLGWLAWIASVYFGRFIISKRNATPYERIAHILGEEKANGAIEGLLAVIRRTDIPSVDTVAATAAGHQVCQWWLAIVAGLDEQWKQSAGLDEWTDGLIGAALAIDLAYPTFENEDNAWQRIERRWKGAAFEARPELARDAYLAVATAALEKGAEHPDGLRELLSNVSFMPFREEITLRLLRRFPNAPASALQDLLRGGFEIETARQELVLLAHQVLDGTVAIDQASRDAWLVAGYFEASHEFESDLAMRAAAEVEIVWLLRDVAGYNRHEHEKAPPLSVDQLECIAGIAAQHFPKAGPPPGGWSGDRNAWDGAEFVDSLINRISADPTEAATEALSRLEADGRLASYRDQIRHALASQRTRRREMEYCQPNWRQTVEALSNRAPANVADLHALLMHNLEDHGARIAGANNNIYKRFWNEDGHGRVLTPKPEESCRDVLIDFLRVSLQPLGIIVEPEGEMMAGRSTDIAVSLPGQKIPVELKRDYHADLWTAAELQLDRFYTRDADALGFGVYGVFWFGDKRPRPIPAPPGGQPRPRSAAEMANMLRAIIPADKRARIAIIVIDVSGAADQPG